MENIEEKLSNMQTVALIDVVRNYKKYRYTEEIRQSALSILAHRGIKQETLQLTGNLENKTYDEVNDQFKNYNKNSIIALVLFGLSILCYASAFLISIFFYLASLVFMGLAFQNHKNILDELHEEKSDYLILFFVLSLVFYFVIYFLTKRDLKDKIQMRT